jgi:hypothetical protein
MKNFSAKLTFGLIAICCALNAAATTRTVNNSTSLPVNPGQYTSIGSAISAASNGDTILVTGNISSYNESPTINKKLTLIGTGYDPQYQQAAVINGYVAFSTGSNGSTIMGFDITCAILFNTSGLRNILVYRNYVAGNICSCGPCYGGGIVLPYNQCSYITIAENVINYGINFSNNANDTGFVIQNNVFLQVSGNCIQDARTSVNAPQMIIDHNIFLAGTYGTPSTTSYTYALQTANAIVTNNIFYGVVPIDTNNSSSYTNNTFDNNLTYASTTIKALPWGSNTGSSNINNANPEFTSTNIFPDAGSPYFDFKNSNLRPLSGSPIIGTALDLTNIGPTGGPYPIYNSSVPWLTGEPPVPEVESATFIGPNAVTPGTSLNLQVKAKKIN